MSLSRVYAGMIFKVFVFLGLIHLLFMLRSDMKNMKIDSRHNRFMTGAAVFMYLTNFPGILFTIMIFVIIFFIGYGLRRYHGMGDVEMASWAIIGFGTLNVVWIPIYVFCLMLLHTIYMMPMRRKGIKKLPGTPIFLGAFILTAAIGFYMDVMAFGG